MSENVHPYRREPLEPEIAAVSFRVADDAPPIVIINVDVHRSLTVAALKKLRPFAIIPLIPALVTAAVERLIRRFREHSSTAILIGTTATAASTISAIAFSPTYTSPSPQKSRPPAAIRVVTLPPTTRTVTAQPSPPPTSPRKQPSTTPVTRSAPDQRRAPPAVTSSPPSPRPRTSRPPSTRPSTRPSSARPDQQTTSPRETAESTPSSAPRHTPTERPAPATRRPAATPEPSTPPAASPTSAARDCVLRVDLDPVVDLCVLG